MKAKEYSLGFAFNKNKTCVALIDKKRPKWQKGKLNGIGGHKEIGETFHDCMVREFKEETGYHQMRWEHYLTMKFFDAVVYCYYSVVPLEKLISMTDEKIIILEINKLHQINIPVITNLKWIIPMALYHNKEPFEKYIIDHLE